MPLDDYVPAPATRTFIVAKTRSGKSTLASALLTEYLRRYGGDVVYIIDPKRRYFATRRPREDRSGVLFPDGVKARMQRYNGGWRRGVRVYAKRIHGAMGFNHEGRVFVVQEPAKIVDLFQWLFRRKDARSNVLVFCDESFDLSRNGRAQEDLKRLIQQGGEISVGTMIINQRPRDIARIFLTESEYLFIGMILHDEDRLYLRKNADAPRGAFDRPLPPYTWLYVNQIDNTSRVFRLNL